MPLQTTYRYTVYKFVVSGQPVPAPRMTAASSHRAPFAIHYYQYLDRVRAAFLDAYPTDQAVLACLARTQKPFHLTHKVHTALAVVRYVLYLATAKNGVCRHGDPDNIAKGLIDALFVDDRHILPQCLGMHCGVPDPRVEVEVEIL